MPFLIFLPFCAYILISVLIFKKSSCGYRVTFLLSSLIWALVAVLLTEGLSFFHALTRTNVAIGWGLGTVIWIALLFCVQNCEAKRSGTGIESFSISINEILFLIVTAVIVGITGINALCSAPNNWDSMTYHLPRVMHWIQNCSVEPYPTHILRQLYQPPGAEYLILQFQILSGNDRLANGVQWFSFLGTLIALSLIASQLGAGKTGQILTAILAATIPMAILQGVSTQNDLVTGYWLANFYYFSFRLAGFSGVAQTRWTDLLASGMALALAMLTKGNAVLFALPMLLMFLVSAVLKKRLSIFRDIILILAICLAVNAGFFGRNIKVFGTPLSGGNEHYLNTGNALANTVVNGVRNLALHWATPWERVNAFMIEKITAWQNWAGNPENNSWDVFFIPPASTNEDIAGNPFHLLLVIGVFGFIFFSGKSGKNLKIYALLVLSGFLFFCATVKWQMFHSRLHLPLFLLSMPPAGAVLEKTRSRWLTIFLTGILTIAALPPLLFNERHPFLGKKNVFNMPRIEQYFFYRKDLVLPYVFAAKFAPMPPGGKVGMILGADDWEYPLWVLFKKDHPDLILEHAGVKNVSGHFSAGKRRPASVILSEIEDAPGEITTVEGKYNRISHFSFMSVYRYAGP